MDLKLQAVRAFIEQGDDFLLTTHVNSDADGLGACMALARLLQGLGKRADIGLPDPPAEQCYFLAGWPDVHHYADLDLSGYSSAIIVDCPSLDRIGPVRENLPTGLRILNIDHHHGNDSFGEINLTEEISSTCELVYHLVAGLGYEIDASMATQLYTGIIFDTGSFRFSLTKPSTFAVAGALVQLGVRLDDIANHVFGNKSFGSVKQLGLAIDSMQLHLADRVAVLHLNLEDMQAGDPDEVVNYGLMVKGVEVAVLLKEQEPQRYRVSLRSRDTVDVSEVAELFGGGGHSRASGLRLEGEASEITEKILAEIGRYLA
ncbi:bifunctional oligoribonuclease/PAP phosphatase NrnA [Candidatus Latescibacteria bacterium]|nr:bifunctional oligoribonuclease/PAP phosphatase NrnA [Candidatus Latescibacterota bacterium]